MILSNKEKVNKGIETTSYNSFAFPEVAEQTTTKSNSYYPISGRITGADGSPLAGVSIAVKGTRRGTTTNANGEFSLDANRGETLVVSYIGYESREIAVSDDQNLTITLNVGEGQMSEVVVTALGIRRERRSLGIQ